MEIEDVINFMIKNPGCTIVGHRDAKGKTVYRVRDSKVNPIANISESDFQKNINNDTFIKKENVWMLNN